MNQEVNTNQEVNAKRNKKIIFLLIGLIAITQFLFTASVASAQMMRDRIVKTDYSQSSIVKRTKDLPFEVKYRLLTMKDYTVFDWLEAKTATNGEVILRGQVTNKTVKANAERIVSEIAGVHKISNRIEILPISKNDDNLRKMLYRAIYNQNTPLFRYTFGSTPSIHIVVKNGYVTLRGDVESETDREMAFVAANAVPQVSQVTNRLQTNGNNLMASAIKIGFYR